MSVNIKKLREFSKVLTVLFVEDNENSRQQALKLLSNFFDKIIQAKDGQEGIELFKSNKIDLIISDINMPIMNGIEMLKKIRGFEEDIPIIMLSAHNDTNSLLETIKLGISGYVLKPLNVEQLIGTINTTLEKLKLQYELQKHKDELQDANANLELQVSKRTKEIEALNEEIVETQKEVVYTISTIGESRSKETGQHVKRVAEYSRLLALYSGMSEKNIELLKLASTMHDIGKVGISDNILNNKNKLTQEEYEIMKTHPKLGYDMLKTSKKPLLQLAATIAYEHHERWDGNGYPRGLKAQEISLCGRITAMADVLDALGSQRIYKQAWKDEEIFKHFKKERAKHFDPALIDIFFEHLDEFMLIRDSFKEKTV